MTSRTTRNGSVRAPRSVGTRRRVTETEKEKTDRQLIELMNELRVALPGAQVLLAFLLTAPFQTRFGRTTGLERAMLFAGILVTAAGVVFLMAPSVYHRVRWNEGGKRDVVHVGHDLFLVGTGALGLGMVCTIFVAADFLFGPGAAIVSVAMLLLCVTIAWYVLPLTRGRDPRIRRTE